MVSFGGVFNLIIHGVLEYGIVFAANCHSGSPVWLTWRLEVKTADENSICLRQSTWNESSHFNDRAWDGHYTSILYW